MTRTSRRSATGFTLIEALVSVSIGLVVLAAAVTLLQKAMQATFLVAQRAEMQQSARAAINSITTDLSRASTGLPQGGVQLPAGGGATNSKFACDASACYLSNNTYLNNRLYAVLPGAGIGPTIQGRVTSAVTLAYVDDSLPLSLCPVASITATGNQLQVGACMTSPPPGTPAFNDAAVGVKIGDLIMVTNANGSAIGTVTNVQSGGLLDFASNDPLNVNQAGAAFGNIAALANPAPPAGQYPESSAMRILAITYFIQVPPGPDGIAGNADDGQPRLMRQVNAQPPVPMAENIENLQLTYDIFDENTGATTANLPNANNAPNQIRKVNASVTARSAFSNNLPGGYQRITLATSVSPRNLSFRDRYQ